MPTYNEKAFRKPILGTQNSQDINIKKTVESVSQTKQQQR